MFVLMGPRQDFLNHSISLITLVISALKCIILQLKGILYMLNKYILCVCTISFFSWYTLTFSRFAVYLSCLLIINIPFILERVRIVSKWNGSTKHLNRLKSYSRAENEIEQREILKWQYISIVTNSIHLRNQEKHSPFNMLRAVFECVSR